MIITLSVIALATGGKLAWDRLTAQHASDKDPTKKEEECGDATARPATAYPIPAEDEMTGNLACLLSRDQKGCLIPMPLMEAC